MLMLTAKSNNLTLMTANHLSASGKMDGEAIKKAAQVPNPGRYDLYVEKGTGTIYACPKDGKGECIDTGETARR